MLKEFGTVLPEDTVIRVHDSTADLRWGLPYREATCMGAAHWLVACMASACMVAAQPHARCMHRPGTGSPSTTHAAVAPQVHRDPGAAGGHGGLGRGGAGRAGHPGQHDRSGARTVPCRSACRQDRCLRAMGVLVYVSCEVWLVAGMDGLGLLNAWAMLQVLRLVQKPH